MLFGGLPLFIIIALAAIIPVVRIARENSKKARQLTRIFQAVELYSEQFDGQKPGLLCRTVEAGLLPVEALSTQDDLTQKGFANDFEYDPLGNLKKIKIRQSALASFEVFGWKDVEDWPDYGENGLIILPVEMSDVAYLRATFYGLESFVRIHENGKIVFRQQNDDYTITDQDYRQLFQATPDQKISSKQSP
ncbi:MAG: hypothetical protein KDC26_03675 [Armatimonadetes bacterium]|nr:hypothetical protein [Armatimonadota bacterium]